MSPKKNSVKQRILFQFLLEMCILWKRYVKSHSKLFDEIEEAVFADTSKMNTYKYE